MIILNGRHLKTLFVLENVGDFISAFIFIFGYHERDAFGFNYSDKSLGRNLTIFV
jgi:hypothetical protein